MHTKAYFILEGFMIEYNPYNKVNNGCLYIYIRQGMYGLLQSVLLPKQIHKTSIKNVVYHELKHTLGIFWNTWLPVIFTIVMGKLWHKVGHKRRYISSNKYT